VGAGAGGCRPHDPGHLVQEEGLALNRVARLPDDLVNKIAAGEVIERPSSVVKELVENALDAEGRTVHVEIEAGGKSLIRVRDDGIGMSREDASVSELTLRTRREDEAAGTEVVVRFGGKPSVRDTGHPRGTTVEVRDLFGSVPARRKFLRADSTEAGHVAEAVMLLALASPDRGFFLGSGGRTVIEAPPVDALGPRLFQLFGAAFLESVVPVAGGQDWARVSGFVSRAEGIRSARPNLRLFVNRRPVRDRSLAKAVAEGFRRAGAGERGFDAFVNLDLPSHLVDVNVHPAKTEVRFAEPRTVFAAVEGAVQAAISAGARRAPQGAVLGPKENGAAEASEPTQAPLSSGMPIAGGGYRYAVATADPFRVAEPGPALDERAAPERELVVLGQHRATYIVATDGEELVLVDQHTAHERIRFEQLQSRGEGRIAESQLLLSPTVIALPPDLRPLLEDSLGELAGLGYDVEAFGGGSLRVRAVPALLGVLEPGEALQRLLRDLRDREGGEWAVAGRRDRLAATLACHSAVRAGQSLNLPAMASIARDLQLTRHPGLCPHGRPTTSRIPRDELSRMFGRTGWTRR
jgi:DNA mismatch repair protein MutL